jgi:hypothetical protein
LQARGRHFRVGKRRLQARKLCLRPYRPGRVAADATCELANGSCEIANDIRGAANAVCEPANGSCGFASPPALVAPGILPRLRPLLQRIQLAPGYTEAIGLNLGIVGADASSAPGASAKPTAKATALAAGQVQIDFSEGSFDGVQVEGRRAGETTWTGLGTDNYSPFVDTRPPAEAAKAEVREYRLRYVRLDEPVGEWSDIATATTRP